MLQLLIVQVSIIINDKLPSVLNQNMCLTFLILTIASATSFPDLATIVLARFRPTILLQSHASDEAENMKLSYIHFIVRMV